MWIRTGRPESITLLRGTERMTCDIGESWKRLVFARFASSTDDALSFGIELAPGVNVDLFGAQVEAQIGTSTYKKTASSGGIYPMTRFGNNGLVLSTIGPGRHGCLVHLKTH
jgi:hypothetical protein